MGPGLDASLLAAERLEEVQHELALLLERWAVRIGEEGDRGHDRAALALERCHDELAEVLARSRP